MAIEISQEARQRAIASLQRYFRENMEDEIGNLTANALLGFFIDEVGAVIYNTAVADVQNRLQARVLEIDAEVYEEPFQYWNKANNSKRR